MADDTRNTEHKTYCTYYFAHQPVFDNRLKVWGYEVLYRANAVSGTAVFTDDCKATLEVMANLSLSPDAGYSLAWTIVNFSARGVREQYPYALPAAKSIIQISESEIIESAITGHDLCPLLGELKQKGYAISIDDFEGRPEAAEACRLADLLTVDFLANSRPELEAILRCARGCEGKILAKKIEDYNTLKTAQELGCSFFQGYFFKKPKMESGRKLASGDLVRIRLLELFEKEEEDLESLVEIFECDVALSIRLLRLLNSPFYGLSKHVTSIRQAVVYCGWNNLRHWLRVIVFTDLAQSLETQELTRLSVLRAKFLQCLAEKQGNGEEAESFFLLGLFSFLEVLLDTPMDLILGQLSNLDKRIKVALSGGDNELTPWLELAKHMENGNWNNVGDAAEDLVLTKDNIIEAHVQAMEWTNSVLTCN